MIYRVAITVSYQIFTVAVGWHIFELTQDVMALGLIGLAEVIPYFCCALFAGHAFDVLPKKKIALFGCAVYALMGAVKSCWHRRLSGLNIRVGLLSGLQSFKWHKSADQPLAVC